jgi:hypothetical protein
MSSLRSKESKLQIVLYLISHILFIKESHIPTSTKLK